MRHSLGGRESRYRVGLSLAAVALLASALSFTVGEAVGGGTIEGGTFRIATAASTLQTVDPAILGGAGGFGSYLTAVCELPLGFAPESKSTSSRVVPDAAVGYPTISRDRRTYTFTIRAGLRFASGAPLTARNYVDAINRSLNPKMHPTDAAELAAGPEGSPWNEIRGAKAVLEGKATSVAGIRARGRKLLVTLDRPDGSFPVSFATYPEVLCPVPPGLPLDPEGIGAPFSGGGPYYVARFVPGQQVVLERNRFYRGTQPHHVDRFVITLAGDPATTLSEIDAGTLDWTDSLPASKQDLAARYGVNRSQFFVHPYPQVDYLILNTSRPLFRNNPRLREAVNFAIDRRAILAAYGAYAGTAIDHYVPTVVSSYRNGDIYPVDGPDLLKARALAAGNTRGGKAIYYARDDPRNQEVAQIVQADLAKIGLDVQIVTLPSPVALDKMGTRGEPFDIGIWGLTCGWDPACFLGQLDGRTITAAGNLDLSYYDSPHFNRLFDAASVLPFGPARDRTFAKLDADVAGHVAPLVALLQRNAGYLFSKRVGCISYAGGWLNYGALCLTANP
jgi:peptide/nickel transport system substrate-binding protein